MREKKGESREKREEEISWLKTMFDIDFLCFGVAFFLVIWIECDN